MEIVIKLPDFLIYFYFMLVDLLMIYMCVGALALAPWSIYRARSIDGCYNYMVNGLGGFLVLVVIWLLWPRAVYGMIKSW